MIEVVIWTKEANGAPITEVILKCDTFDENNNKLTYVSSRTKKGRKKQSWYSKYKSFSLSFSRLIQSDKEKLERIIDEKEFGIQLFYNNAIYDIAIEAETSKFTPTFSATLNTYIYSGDLQLEEISSEADPLSDYMQTPITTFPIYEDKESIINVEGYVVGGRRLEFYNGGFYSEDPSSYITKYDFDYLTLYRKAQYLNYPVEDFQGAKASFYGVAKSQKIDFANDDAVTTMESPTLIYKNDKHVGSLNSDTEAYHIGGNYFNGSLRVRTSQCSKRDFDTEVLSISAQSLTDNIDKIMGAGNDSVGILAGGAYDNTGGETYLKSLSYATETLSDIAVLLDNPLAGHATATSYAYAYFIGGYNYINDDQFSSYNMSTSRYCYSTETIQVLTDTLDYDFKYVDGVNNQDFAILIKYGDSSGTISIVTPTISLFEFVYDSYYSTAYLDWDIPVRGASCFQSGIGNY